MSDTTDTFITTIQDEQMFYCMDNFPMYEDDLYDLIAEYIDAKRGDPDYEDQVRAFFDSTAVYPAKPVIWPCIRHTILNLDSLENHVFGDVSGYAEEPVFELIGEEREKIDDALAAIAGRLTASLPEWYTADINIRFDPGVLTQRYLATGAK
jgi:hypothetical protein